MDDFDSFSTVVTATPQKDDFDSFSTVVSEDKPKAAPAKAAPAKVVSKPSLLDRAKAAIGEGVDNLKKEVSNGTALDNAVAGGIHGVMSLAGGASQIVAHGLKAGADKFAPGTGFQQWADKTQALTDADVQRVEDNYQRGTKGSVVAGLARAGTSLAPMGAAERGASMAVKIGTGAKNGATAAVLQPVDNAGDMTNGKFAVEKGKQALIGAGLGAAAPVVAKGALEAASKVGIKPAERILTDTRSAQLFDKSPNAKADAEVITELGGIKDRIGDRKILTNDINARAVKLQTETLDALKAAGATREQLTQMKTWQGMTQAERDAMQNEPMGKAVADIMGKLDRVRALTPGALANSTMAPARALTDIAPIPAPVRWGIRNMLGGSQTRAKTAEKLLDDRSQRAAQNYLDANGPSDATMGMQSLLDMGAKAKAAKAAADAAKAAGKNPTAGMSDFDIVQRAIDRQNAKAVAAKPLPMTPQQKYEAQRIAEQNKAMTDDPSLIIPSVPSPAQSATTASQLKADILARAKERAKQSQALADQISKDPSLLVPSARDPRQFSQTAQTLKDDILARMKQKVDADKAAAASQEAADSRALQIKARKVSGTPGGGAYQALLQHTGLSADNLNQTLRIAEKIPEAAPHVRAIRVDGGNTTDGAIYPITDIVKSIADKMGMQRGALTQSQPAGILSDATEKVSARYQMGTAVRQKLYKDVQAKAADLGDAETRKAVTDLAGKLKSTPKRTERISLIDSLEAKYPEAKGLFDEVRNFK